MALTPNFTLLALFFLWFSAVLAHVAPANNDALASYRRETNAQRFARGLPPARPNKLYDATRTGPALARRSVVPANGLITAFIGDGPAICYFTEGFTCTTDINSAWTFTAGVGAGSPTPQNIIVTTPAGAGFHFAAFSSGGVEQGPTLTSEDVVFGDFSLTPTPEGGVAELDGDFGLYYETAIWSVAADGTLTASWVNPTGDPQGDTVPLIFFQTTTSDEVQGSGNPAYIAGQVGASVLTLKLLPPPP